MLANCFFFLKTIVIWYLFNFYSPPPPLKKLKISKIKISKIIVIFNKIEHYYYIIITYSIAIFSKVSLARLLR